MSLPTPPPHLPQTGNRVLLPPISLHPVVVGAQQLQVLYVAGVAAGLGDDVVNLQVSELEGGAAPIALAFMLAIQYVLVMAIGTRRI